jgi:hypothetical protein
MANAKPEHDSVWQKTPYTNLIRYQSSQVDSARIKVKGKLIRWSLRTNLITVAKIQFADLEKAEHQKTRASPQLQTDE